MKKEKTKDEHIEATVIVVLVFLLVILVIGVTYAAFHYSGVGQTENKITTGTMTMDYIEGDTGITITNAMPITENVGKALSSNNEVFDFTISTTITGNQGIDYEVTAVKQDNSTLDNNDVRLYLQSGTAPNSYTTEVLAPTMYIPITADDTYGAKTGEMILVTATSTITQTTYYRLRMWVDSSYNITGVSKTFSIKVNAYGKNITNS